MNNDDKEYQDAKEYLKKAILKAIKKNMDKDEILSIFGDLDDACILCKMEMIKFDPKIGRMTMWATAVMKRVQYEGTIEI